ncbi:SWI/SNF chromatin-remodeling complex subunit [Podochytrium sp. JEL0797]|nr:SWI/SNF chromatin-remodeling complex subunit [Podochytrium sp. JEL0797]
MDTSEVASHLPIVGFKFSALPQPPLVSLTGSPVNDVLPVVLVPIKLDFDVETHGFRLRDQFHWNLNEQRITTEMYAQQLVADFRLHPQVATPEIAKAIKEQIDEFVDISYMRPPPLSQGHLPPVSLPAHPLPANVIPPPEIQLDHDNLRVFLKIDVSIGGVTVMDNVEWDLNCARNLDVEAFAGCVCEEVGLTGEFRVAIAHQLREQIQMYHRTLTLLEHPFDDSEIQDEDLWFNHFLPTLKEAKRPKDQHSFCGPTVLTGAMPSTAPASIDEKTAAQRKRRSGTTRTRGRNLLPDREVARYWSTALPMWKNGVKLPPILSNPLGTTGGPGTPGQLSSLLGKRRTRHDAAMESLEEEMMESVKEQGLAMEVVAETFMGQLGVTKQQKAKGWVCGGCGGKVWETRVVRGGAGGKGEMCDECVVEMERGGKVGKKGKAGGEKRWFVYPEVVDATSDRDS